MRETRGAGPSQPLDALAQQARGGDRAALESLVRAVQGDVYALALRFLWHPQDAEDATQEILVRVITGLGGFRGESRFRTWLYRVACNTLLSLKAQRMERRAMSFEEFGEDLGQGLSDATPAAQGDADHALVLEEIKIGCTLGMLLCLDRDQRMAYILGEIMELDHNDASEALQTSRAAFRKRLSRARQRIETFMLSRCGLVNSANACRCSRRVDTAIACGRVDPTHLLFASSLAQAKRFPALLHEIRALEDLRRAAALYRSHPIPQPSADFAAWLRKLIAERTMPSAFGSSRGSTRRGQMVVREAGHGRRGRGR